MKLLSALCVVLYLRSGELVLAQNIGPDIVYPTQMHNNVYAQRNIDVPINLPHIYRPGSSEQRQEAEKQSDSGSQIIQKKDDSMFESRRNFPVYGNTQERRNMYDPSSNVNFQAQIPLANINSYQNRGGSEQHFFLRDVSSEYMKHQPNINSPPPISQQNSKLMSLLSKPVKQINELQLRSTENTSGKLRSPEYINHQSFQNMNAEPLYRQEDISSMITNSRNINIHPTQTREPQYRSEEDLSGTVLKLPGSSPEYMKHESLQVMNTLPLQNQKNILSTITNSRYLNSQLIKKTNEPQYTKKDDISEEETRLELEGLSSDFIQSLINKNTSAKKDYKPLRNSYRNVNKANEYLINNNQDSLKSQLSNVPTFQSPSAEFLYKMEKALPYETQLPNQGNNNLKNILYNSKRSEDINKSAQPIKFYTVIYPDGRTERVEKIDKIIERYPNHVIVNSEDYLNYLKVRSNTFMTPIDNPQTAAVKELYNDENQSFSDITFTQQLPVVNKPVFYVNNALATSTEKQTKVISENIHNETKNVAPMATIFEVDTETKNPLSSLIINSTTPAEETYTEENHSQILDTTLSYIKKTQMENQTKVVSEKKSNEKNNVDTLTPVSDTNNPLSSLIMNNTALSEIIYNDENQSFSDITFTQQLPVVNKPVFYVNNALETSTEKQTKVISENIHNETKNVAPMATIFEVDTETKNPLSSLIINSTTPAEETYTEENHSLILDTTLSYINKTQMKNQTKVVREKKSNEKNSVDTLTPVSDTNNPLSSLIMNNTALPEIIYNEENQISPGIAITVVSPNLDKPITYIDTTLVKSTEKQTEFTSKNIPNDVQNISPLTIGYKINADTYNPLAALIINTTASAAVQQDKEQDNYSDQNSTNVSIETANSDNSDDLIYEPMIRTLIPDSESNRTENDLPIKTADVEVTQSQTPSNSDSASDVEIYYTIEDRPISHEIVSNNDSLNLINSDEISEGTLEKEQITTTPAASLDEIVIPNIPESPTDEHFNATEIKTVNTDETSSENIESLKNNTVFWFEADENFWKTVMTSNNAQNQYYFLFLQPNAKSEKETKIIIYPNGTTVEEVIETVAEDDGPKKYTTRKITYADNTTTIE